MGMGILATMGIEGNWEMDYFEYAKRFSEIRVDREVHGKE
jgi:hypothetical protein